MARLECHAGMLREISLLLFHGITLTILSRESIRAKLNPHPAGQKSENVPFVNGQGLEGVQHKYPETVLFFPTEGQD